MRCRQRALMQVKGLMPMLPATSWAVGYGVDVAIPVNYTSDVVVQQAYVEARWLYGVLTAGAKEYPMELKNQSLSSGSQCLGINARPIPQVRLALPEYWTLPFGRGWLQLKGHLAYGMTTDDGWQHDFTKRQTKYLTTCSITAKLVSCVSETRMLSVRSA